MVIMPISTVYIYIASMFALSEIYRPPTYETVGYHYRQWHPCYTWMGPGAISLICKELELNIFMKWHFGLTWSWVTIYGDSTSSKTKFIYFHTMATGLRWYIYNFGSLAKLWMLWAHWQIGTSTGMQLWYFRPQSIQEPAKPPTNLPRWNNKHYYCHIHMIHWIVLSKLQVNTNSKGAMIQFSHNIGMWQNSFPTIWYMSWCSNHDMIHI